MSAHFTLAITGDCILNRRVSVITDEKFLALVKILREADIACTHLETLIHDYTGPELYPAAEGGGTWQRSPGFAAEELKWMGFDIVSTAGNHSLDYSYGGLFSTWAACDKAGLPHAGTGMDLGAARAPAYVDTDKARVALVSMSSSFTNWSRAGEANQDLGGRPGLNPLRYYHRVDTATLEKIREVAVTLGMWVARAGDEWHVSPPGCHNTRQVFVHDEDIDGVATAVDEDDLAGNVRAVKDARRQADYVIVHVHNHEWDHRSDLSKPADFVRPFAHACIDAGADVFVAQGSHAPFRGIEIHRGRPIFYDPGDLVLMSRTISRLPADFYWRIPDANRRRQASTADGMDALDTYPPKPPYNPPGGFFAQPVTGALVPVCSFDRDNRLVEIKLHPVTLTKTPRSRRGLPLQAQPDVAREIIEFVATLSAPYGTTIKFHDNAGLVEL